MANLLSLAPLHLADRIYRWIENSISNILYRSIVASVGKRTRFQRSIWIAKPGSVFIGSDCLIAHKVIMGTEISGSRISIGDRVQINANCLIDHSGGITIGDDVLISQDVIIYTHDHGLDPRSEPMPFAKEISNGAWIGVRAIILPGCTRVGARAIVGAGAIVTCDVPDGAIVAGNPARIIGTVNEHD